MRKTKPKQDQIFLSIFESKEAEQEAHADPGTSSRQSPEEAGPDTPCPLPDETTVFSEPPSVPPAPPLITEPSVLVTSVPIFDAIAPAPPEAPSAPSPAGEANEQPLPCFSPLIPPDEPAPFPGSACPRELLVTSPQVETPEVLSQHHPEPVSQATSCGTTEFTSPVTPPLARVEPFRPAVPEFSFLYVSPGSLVMGSPEHEPGRNADETPHEVTITKGFYLQSAPLTQQEWQLVMGANPSRFQDEFGELPLENVSWFECQRFIERLNTLGEHRYRLPTEAEWEYACRAGTTAPCPAGEITELFCGYDENLDSVGWYCGNSGRTTHPVGSKRPNPWGLYDMLGNVFEWCQDWYAEYVPAPTQDPVGPITGPGRVIRGGSWFSNAKNCRSASRFFRPPESKSDLVGFRLVRKASPEKDPQSPT